MKALTEKGFLRPTYDEIVERLVTLAKGLFGDDIETDEKTPLGKYIRLIAKGLAETYEDIEGHYYAHFVNTARGLSLDRLCVLAGISRNAPIRAIHVVEFTGTPEYEIPSGFLVSTADDVLFYTEDVLTIPESGKIEGYVYCTVPGTVGNVKVGSISQIVNPNMNIESITHKDVYQLGDEEETDAELRARFLLAIAGSGSATIDAIRAEILRVPKVQSCIIEENDTENTDEAGRPGHSFECYVLAPEEQDELIAQAIFRKKPIGIKSVGDVTVAVVDNGGFSHDIKFSRTTATNIYIKATVKVNSLFPRDGRDQIISNLVYYVDSMPNGEDVIQSSFYSKIYAVAGVKDVTVLQLSTDGTSYSTNNITCTPAQVARLPVENITLEVENYVDT